MHYTTRLVDVVQADDVIGMHYYCFNCQFRPPVGKLLLRGVMKHALGRKTTICPELQKAKSYLDSRLKMMRLSATMVAVEVLGRWGHNTAFYDRPYLYHVVMCAEIILRRRYKTQGALCRDLSSTQAWTHIAMS